MGKTDDPTNRQDAVRSVRKKYLADTRWSERDGRKLDRRAKVAWMAVTGLRHPIGAKAWLANLVGCTARAVVLWTGGKHSPLRSDEGRSAIAELESIEEQNASKLAAAAARLAEWEAAHHGE